MLALCLHCLFSRLSGLWPCPGYGTTMCCASRGWYGGGGGGMNSVVAILLSDLVPLKDRGVWQGKISILFFAGTATGAPLGGILADSVGWRW